MSCICGSDEHSPPLSPYPATPTGGIPSPYPAEAGGTPLSLFPSQPIPLLALAVQASRQCQ